MSTILETKDLSKHYKDFKLKNINLQLSSGKILGFIGQNGSGKTTTLKAILGIIKYKGSISLFGVDDDKENRKKREEAKEDIGVVLDNSFFSNSLIPIDINNIMKDCYKNWDKDLYFKYLKDFDLPKLKSIRKFSTGMKKKLEIATALSHHPRLLILDEPTSGLDPIARQEILQVFQDFVYDGECSILLSTHITTDVEAIADDILLINNGETLLSMPYKEIMNKYGIVGLTQEEFDRINHHDFIKCIKMKNSCEVLVDKNTFTKKYGKYKMDDTNLEKLMTLMVKGEEK